MNKYSRNQRIAVLTKILTEKPNKIINLNYFSSMFNTSKSTISEDLLIIKDTFASINIGKIETISGACGGIKFINGLSDNEAKKFAQNLCVKLQDRQRIVPGDFLYMTDIMCNPNIIRKAGIILASSFQNEKLDYVVTVETKGIPLAYEVSKLLNLQLVVVRQDNKLTEGPTVSINYISGVSRRIQNMSLSKMALKKGSSCIFIDDFMRAGGTAFGIIDLLKEFESKLLGIGILVDNINTPKKLVSNYISIIDFDGINDEGSAVVCPSELFR